MSSYKKLKIYKYQLQADLEYSTGIIIEQQQDLGFVAIAKDGLLTIKRNYAWDGPSGIAIDTDTFMKGSLIHDALYQLMREGALPQNARKRADEIMREVCLESGMLWLRACYTYYAVRWGAAKAAKANILAFV
ncbi:MAG: DUF1353 domain-containing protein [Lentisphaeraceae bacterium]|nr:DUF1353 domain-containing protein [Lentisphaeraceae bacterium]